MLTTFILSQVGEKQNELVYCNKPFEKLKLSEYLYNITGKLSDKSSFFRCFRMKKDVVLAYYWKTTYSELKSGRKGLFVIIGFIIDNNLLHNFEPVINYTKLFFRSLQELFNISFEETISDKFFIQLQNNVDSQMKSLKECAINVKSLRVKCLINIKYRRKGRNFPKAIYCVDNRDFFINWTIFSFEALRFVKRGYWDISNLKNTTPSSFQILNNGECFPKELSRILLKFYHHHFYILIF